jgi:hypothetical protein
MMDQCVRSGFVPSSDNGIGITPMTDRINLFGWAIIIAAVPQSTGNRFHLQSSHTAIS